MFLIKAFAEPRSGKSGVQRNINNLTGVNRGENPQSRYYRQDQVGYVGATAKTRGTPATAREVTRGNRG